MTERTWEPILEGALADRAWQAVREICDAVAEFSAGDREIVDQALFWAYAAGALEDDVTQQRLDLAAEGFANRLELGFQGLGLYGGVLGAGWVAQHLAPDDDGNDELYALIDDELAAAMGVERWQGDYDLISGLVGFGVYLIERVQSPRPGSAAQTLTRLVHHLDQLGERTDDGIRWFTAPERLPPWQRELSPNGYYNLGLAHGVPGIIALLGLVQASPARSGVADELLRGAVRWMESEKLPPTPRGCFPSMTNDRHPPSPSRTAWCYGDPGVAAAMWAAARRAGGGSWEADAIAVARMSAERPTELCGVQDAGLCHGAAGLAHIFNRYYQASRDPVFRDAALRWFERTLEIRRPGEGVGGILAYRVEGANHSWEPNASFLEGAMGVGLALLGGLGVDPGWDRLLLCDVPLE